MENHIPGFNNIEFILNLTSIQAKVLMKNHFYSDLGFKEIEFVSEN
ncbi:MAG: hypothetical protein Q7R95_11330 [bacterium]|nr:hypothetical protein [bacterium]